MLARKLMGAAGGGVESQLYVDDVFSTYVRTGTGADQTVTTNIDMTEGYMVWSKGRSGATDHALYDSARGVTKDLVSNSTAAETTQATGLKAVSSTGHTIGSLAKMNTSSATYVDFVFRRAPKFFDVVTYTGNGTTRTINHNLGSAPGMVIVKSTNNSGYGWYVYHRSVGGTKCLLLNSANAQYNVTTVWNSTEPTSTQFTVGSHPAVNTNNDTYIAYLFAHDTEEDGIIQCGSFDASGNITLGWEPQFLLVKNTASSSDWFMYDTMRGLNADIPAGGRLAANSSAAEGGASNFSINSTGFYQSAFGQNCIYLAIRRPNKPPTSGTEVYNAIARTGTAAGVANPITCGFAPDFLLTINRPHTSFGHTPIGARLIGGNKLLYTNNTSSETTTSSGLEAFVNDGVIVGNYASHNAASPYINFFFRRAPGFFDVVCYTGTGNNLEVPHSLGAAPELIILKSRSAAVGWPVYHSTIGNTQFGYLNTTAVFSSDSTAWNNTSPTPYVFTVGTGTLMNVSAYNYVAYLFATLAGISKVFSYTGNGTTQNIDCGFSTGARFVLCKRTDSTGDWFVFDSVRGIISANDPHLSLNTTAAEVTTDDSIDPYSSGFTVNQNTVTNLNVNNATYIGLAIA